MKNRVKSPVFILASREILYAGVVAGPDPTTKPQDFGEQKSPALQLRGGTEQSFPKNKNPTFRKIGSSRYYL